MSPRHLTMGLLFLFQTTVGVLGNVFLLSHYLFLSFAKSWLRATDLILKNLTLANALVILSKGIPQTMATFGCEDFLSDLGCKLVFYVHSVSRRVSVSSTCLLSVFWAIIMSPGNSRWAELKTRLSRHRGTSLFLIWTLHMLIFVCFPLYVTSKVGNATTTKKRDLVYCASTINDKTTNSLFVALLFFPDAVSLGLMIWASAFMVFTLHKHREKVQHIHSNGVSPTSSPEIRATQTILLFVSIFASFYTLSTILQICISLSSNPNRWLVDIAVLCAACFPTVSPFVLMNSDSRVSRFHFVWLCNRKLLHLTRKV